MLKKLMQPKWLGGLALATVFAVACYFLGHWQWSRYEEKAERNAALDRNYAAEPVDFGAVVGAEGVLPGADWSRVELRGVYDAEQVFVRNRPNQGIYGYEVLAVLQTEGAGPVVVNRGWVRNSPEGAAVLPEVAPLPPEAVTVIGWVRPFERSLGRDLPAGQVASIAAADVAEATGIEPAGAYVRAQSESTSDGPVDSTLFPMEPPDRSLGPHQAYAVQWWLTMALGYAFVVLGIRRELRMERGEDDPQGSAAHRISKPKKVSRWDEDDS